MLFTLRNLGRLEEATIDLGKDLIVLTGLNNTSKTYVAHAIYGFCRENVATYQASFERIFADVSKQAPAEDGSLTVDLMGLAHAHVDFMLEHAQANSHTRLATIFAADRNFVGRATTAVSLTATQRSEVLRRILAAPLPQAIPGQVATLSKTMGAGTFTLVRLPGPTVSNGDHGSPPPLSLHQLAALLTASWIYNELFAELRFPYILTAERNAILLFSRELSLKRSELVESMLSASGAMDPFGFPAALGFPIDPLQLLRQSARLYPLAIQDSLRIADNLGEGRKSTSDDFAPMADTLERTILGGNIQVTEEGEMRFRPADSDANLVLHLSSSSVKSLASLSFYLRHVALKGQFLIIDEPELNLHPHNQRLVARLLARLSRSGIKVMISTHSDYIVRELNNLIMLSRDEDGKLRAKHGYGADEILSPERVGAYVFDGVHGRPIEIGPAGIKVEAFDQDIKELNRSASDIYFTLEDREDEA